MLLARPLTDHRSIRNPARSICKRSPAQIHFCASQSHHQRTLQNCQATEDHKTKAVEYKTSATDAAFIGLCRKAYGNIAGWQSERDWKDGDDTYKGMVEVSRALMKVQSKFYSFLIDISIEGIYLYFDRRIEVSNTCVKNAT